MTKSQPTPVGPPIKFKKRSKTMGDYLKQQYEERDLAKTLAKKHGLIDQKQESQIADLSKKVKTSKRNGRRYIK